MSELRFDALELAIAALEQGLDEHRQYPQLLTVRDGVIQRFEIVMDLSRKMIIRVLKDIMGLDDIIANNKTFIREGAKFGLIADAEAWMRYIESRNQTSHTYDAQIAEQVFSHVAAFLPDAKDLLERLRRAAA